MTPDGFRPTDEGAAMVAEMNYGHNPRAYLCSKRPDDQAPHSEALCTLCADGFEALTWKRKVTALRSRLYDLAYQFDGEANDWSNDPAAMGAKADAAARIREALQ